MRLQPCQLAPDFDDWPPLGICNRDNGEVVGTACDVDTRSLFIASSEMLVALKAIVARHDGVFDDPHLIAMGPLTSKAEDIVRFATTAIAKAEGRS